MGRTNYIRKYSLKNTLLSKLLSKLSKNHCYQRYQIKVIKKLIYISLYYYFDHLWTECTLMMLEGNRNSPLQPSGYEKGVKGEADFVNL